MTGDIQLIDTHLHLHLAQFDADREQTIARAQAVQVARLVEVGYDLESSRAALALAVAHPAIYAVVGIQPHYAALANADWLAEIRQLAAHPKVVAIGEIGLDYHHDRAAHDAQERLVVIHSREAQADTVQILRDTVRGQPGIMHSFSGDWAYAEACLEVGFQLSFSGPVTFNKATDLHEVARRAPLDRILTETDSPYLAPHPLRGKRNEPANVRLVAERLAALREIALEELAAAVWRNACEVLGLPLRP